MKDVHIKEDCLFLEIDSRQNAETNVKKMQNIINKAKAQKVFINLCGLNMFDAIKISSLISAYGLTDDIHRKFELLADNKVVMGHIRLLGLSNMKASLNCQKQEAIVSL